MTGKEFITVAKATVRELGRDDIGYLAAALTYYIFFSVFPLILLGITFATLFLNPKDATVFVLNTAGQFTPGLSQFLLNTLTEAMSHRSNAGLAALVGIVTLLFTGTGAFEALDNAINRAWNSERAASFFKDKLTSFFMLLIVGVLLLSSVLISTALTATRTFTSSIIGEAQGSQLTWAIVNFAASTAVIFVGFVLMYRFLPRCRVSFRDVWRGALLGSVVWSVAKEIFALYLGSTFVNYSAVYGTVGTVIALLTWIYVSSLIILTGAEFAAETARVREMRAKVVGDSDAQGTSEETGPPTSPDGAVKRSPWFS